MHKIITYLANIVILLIVVSSTKGESSKFDEVRVNGSYQQIIADKHNALRLLLARGEVNGQPRACNMKRLYFDTKLAERAQQLTDRCVYQHDSPEDPRWSWVGQNIMMSASYDNEPRETWESIIQLWFDEYSLYHYPDPMKHETGHYTQVAWADTQYVGCALTKCPATMAGGRYQNIYACNYGPGGNVGDEAPYETIKNGQCGCENLC